MDTKQINFLDVYQPPFSVDDCLVYIYSNNHGRAFNCLVRNREAMNDIVDILNGKSDKKIQKWVRYSNCTIYIDERPILLIRGWGHLIGVGGLNLPAEQAEKTQDDFGEWVVRKLKGE